jgi:phospholipid transport system substrate-binding protein
VARWGISRRAAGDEPEEPIDMLKTLLTRCTLVCTLVLAALAHAQTSPDALVRQISTEVIDTAKADKAIQAGDVGRIITLVDTKVMPHVNFQRMTALSVGRHWRAATPDQQKRLQDEFKILLVRTYAGALTQVKDQTVQLKPYRAAAEDTEVVVRTEVKGKGEPIQLDYRLEKTDGGWKIEQYVLSLAVPNDLASPIARIIKTYETAKETPAP